MLILSAASILFLSTFIQLFLSPFTKVEESFNLHAIHDFIHQPSLQAIAHSGDHVQFPGPVPRTFIGALLIGSIARLTFPIFRFFQLINSKFGEQVLTRAILATFNSSALVYFGLCTRVVFGDFVATLLLLISASQFHLNFYSSRTLPNMLAFPFVQVGLGQLILTMRRGVARPSRKRWTLNACSFITFAAIVFRIELIGLLVPITLWSLLSERVTFWQLISRGFLATFAGLEMTIPIDSYFWQRLTWPEAAALLFNVVEGKSAQWGIMPWHFYFTSSLPRLLGLGYPFALLGFVLNHKMLLLGSCTLFFVAVMSCLGHKETRFIIYVVPVWNLSTAICINRLSGFFSYSRWIKLGLISVVMGSSLLTMAGMTYLSMHNYPGGVAMVKLHSPDLIDQLAGAGKNLKVHMDDLVCQTGGSRFLQLNDHDGAQAYPVVRQAEGESNRQLWDYDKLANLTEGVEHFDLIVSERPSFPHFHALAHVQAFSAIRWQHPQSLINSILHQPLPCSPLNPSCTLQALWVHFSPVHINFINRISIFLNDDYTHNLPSFRSLEST